MTKQTVANCSLLGLYQLLYYRYFLLLFFSKFLKFTFERLLYLTLKFRWLIRIRLKRVTMGESLYIKFLYVQKGVPVPEIMKHFLGYSSATIFRYVKRTVNRPFNKQKLNKGRPKKLLLRVEQKHCETDHQDEIKNRVL